MVATLPVEDSALSQRIAGVVDGALVSMRDRTTLSARDMIDVLLDLRSTLRETVELEEALVRPESPTRPRAAWGETARRAATSGLGRRSMQVTRFLRARSF
jgi:hypothetical protein